MAWVPIISIIFLLIILLYYSRISEGFFGETLHDRAVDRVNPLAGNENPLNPLNPIGISEVNGVSQRNMFQTALNIPTVMARNGVSFSQVNPNNQVSSRIDNENSFLGLSKFCKDNGKGDRPFDNAAFNENCGMCVSSGTLYDKSTFTTPTGVLVYKADKEQFIQEKSSNKYPFTRAIPSLAASVCVGASKGSDAQPVLAINQDEYDKYLKRHKCIHGNGSSCGKCQTNNNMSWIDEAGGFKVSKIILWGSGKASVSVAGVKKGSLSDLSLTTATEYPLGTVKEGALVQIDIANADIPSIYGILVSTTPLGEAYSLAIDQFIETDTFTGSSPRYGLSQSFTVSNKSVSVTEIKAQPNKTSLTVTGPFPLTFVDSDQLAAYDCLNGPYVMADFSILSSDDPCANPKGQKVDNYSTACLKKTLSDGGCSDGTWYTNTDSLRADYIGKTIGEMKTLFLAGNPNNREFMLKCKGQDISTPCDDYLTGGVPNAACLLYLYKGGNATWTQRGLGAIYSGTPYNAGGEFSFCQATGSLNPSTSNELSSKASEGYQGLTGIDAVKKYLTDVFSKSTGDLEKNIPDAMGGRYDSWMKCIGDTSTTLATVPDAPTVNGTAGDGSASISWTPGANGGSAIIDYIVTSVGGASPGTITKTANTANITGLTNGNNYTVSVSARNKIGISSSGQVTLMPIGNPSAPTGVTATAGIGSASITWTAVPASASGGATITEYTVIPSPACPTCTGLTTTGVTTTITGLTNNTAYTFRVTAKNSGGKVSPQSDPSSSVSPVFAAGTTSGPSYCGSGPNFNRSQNYNNGTGGTYTTIITEKDTTCGYLAPCATLGQTGSDCGTTGMRQNYTWGNGTTSGSCVKNNVGSPVCDPTCANAKADGGCAQCDKVGQTGSECGTNGMKQNYTWANNNGECVKNNVGTPICQPSACPAATGPGGCTGCLWRAAGQTCSNNERCNLGRCDYKWQSGIEYSGICVTCDSSCNGQCSYVDGVYGQLYVPGAPFTS